MQTWEATTAKLITSSLWDVESSKPALTKVLFQRCAYHTASLDTGQNPNQNLLQNLPICISALAQCTNDPFHLSSARLLSLLLG